MPKHITKETKENIVSFYKSKPMTIDNVAKEFNISNPSVIKILDEYRIKRYTKSKLFSPDLVENYFENIDTEKKAYFLGLLISDGCVHNTKGKQSLVNLSLKEEDSYLIEEFKNEIHLNKNITQDGRGCSEISVLSNKMVKDLMQYGLTFQKSLSTIFPQNINNNLYRHLIRGIIDGDGSMSFYDRPNRKCHVKAIRLCQGNKKFLEDIVDYLFLECDIEKINVYQEKETLWSIAYRKDESMIKLIHYLYDDAHIFMERKKHISNLIYDEIIKYGNTEITNWNKSQLVS